MNIVVASADWASELCVLDHSLAFSAHWTLTGWQMELKQPAAKVWSAWQAEQLLGFLCVRGVLDQYEITNLAVKQSAQRKGIATHLLTHGIDALKAAGCTYLSLEVSAQNLAAQALYVKAGFTKQSVRKQFYTDGSDAWILGKNI